MKIATFSTNISPEIGTLLAGYSSHDVSIAKHDDLFCTGIIIDDGERRAALLAFDLLGLNRDLVVQIRREVSVATGIEEKYVVLTCSHTHEGPHTRDNTSEPIDKAYCKEMIPKVVKAAGETVKKDFIEVTPYFYSANVPVNVNRRYCGPENICHFLPHHRALEALSDGIVDSELGMVFFYSVKDDVPVASIANFSAHPLINHSPGVGGLAISADYPGDFREKITADTGSFCIFTTGAAGNQFPKGSELGYSQVEEVTRHLAAEFIRGMTDARRNPDLFQLENRVRCGSESLTVALRSDASFDPLYERMKNCSDYQIELQFLAIGDVCFVGVPGELEVEPGLEIKWHSPFRRTWILYNSTDYAGYICPANDFVSGGYESAYGQSIEFRGALKLVNAAVDGLFKLHDENIDVPPFHNVKHRP